uniref:Uncharacterized protein n=1 Tax=Anopheles culicifacies TaxID=139723 RepID=A0A182MNI6_9DIPT
MADQERAPTARLGTIGHGRNTVQVVANADSTFLRPIGDGAQFRLVDQDIPGQVDFIGLEKSVDFGHLCVSFDVTIVDGTHLFHVEVGKQLIEFFSQGSRIGKSCAEESQDDWKEFLGKSENITPNVARYTMIAFSWA